MKIYALIFTVTLFSIICNGVAQEIQYAPQSPTPGGSCGYTQRTLVQNEGSNVQSYNTASLEQCKQYCTSNDRCNSFTYCKTGANCHLKTKEINQYEPKKECNTLLCSCRSYYPLTSCKGCECGKQCEMIGGGTGVCQEDGQTCANNFLPPNCPGTGWSGWSLVAARKECDGSEIYKGNFDVVDECAEACKGVASMFAFGTNDYGTTRCYNDGCKCLCETSANNGGTCNSVNHDGYRLYRYGEIEARETCKRQGEYCGYAGNGNDYGECCNNMDCTYDAKVGGAGTCTTCKRQGEYCGPTENGFDYGSCCNNMDCTYSDRRVGGAGTCTNYQPPEPPCVDDKFWTDFKHGDGKAKCEDLTRKWCNDGNGRSDYAIEARRACPFSCQLC